MRHHVAGSTPSPAGADLDPNSKSKKNRGSYNCGRCGQPKKGHVCNFTITNTASTPVPLPVTPAAISIQPAPSVASSTALPFSNLRRALSFDDDRESVFEEEGEGVEDVEGEEEGGEEERGWFEVMRRLQPEALMAAAKVCTGWRDVARKVWRSVEELRVTVPKTAMGAGFVGSLLKKCPMLTKLALRMESDMDATILACIAFSCPGLESLEISIAESTANRITGDELNRFVGDRRSLTSLKMEGCSNLSNIVISSSSLTTLWLSDINSLSRTVFNCPNLEEVSLDFSRQANDSTDLVSMMDGLGRGCPRLQNIHIASIRLTHKVVLALTAAGLRELRMLSLILGSGITDASVAAIASAYSDLELLDLSGSSISDSGIGMICGVFPETLSRLLLALCPNVTSSGIQFATAQLPLLELMDCGMTVSDPEPVSPTQDDGEDLEPLIETKKKSHFARQKLIVKHDKLKKFSLWGCSGLDAIYMNCSKLSDLNLNSCRNLHPERLILQCPNLQTVHASGCSEKLVSIIKKQVASRPNDAQNYFPFKRMPDSSKRVRVPLFLHQPTDNEKGEKCPSKRQCTVHVG